MISATLANDPSTTAVLPPLSRPFGRNWCIFKKGLCILRLVNTMNILVFRIFRKIKFYMQIPMGLDTVDTNFSTIILFLPCDYFIDLVKIHVDHFQCIVNNFFILKWSVPALNSFN